jgi:very-long-chain enoyl-CoA reductase
MLVSTIANIVPPTLSGVGGIAITATQVFASLLSYSNETNPQTRAQYSKFVQLEKNESQEMISSKDGMTIIYLPAFVASGIILSLGTTGILPVSPSLAGIFVNIHFIKRLLEVLFLHKYSGKVSKQISSGIGIYYMLISILICCVATSSPGTNSMIAGSALFTTGLFGNLYHHLKLAQLRKDSSPGAKYVAPKGGLFKYVAAPHYFFELICWLGIAIASEHGNAFLVFASMTSYLSGRAVSQNQWNREQFTEKDWPAERKNIVPFIF